MSFPIAEFSKYFIDSVQECFSTQAATPVQISPVDKALVKGDLISTLGFAATQATGSVSLVFPVDPFLKIVNKLFGEAETKVTESNADAASEFLNIIYAGSRKRMNLHGFDFSLAIPTVVVGSNMNVSDAKATYSFCYKAESDAGVFYFTGSFNVQNNK